MTDESQPWVEGENLREAYWGAISACAQAQSEHESHPDDPILPVKLIFYTTVLEVFSCQRVIVSKIL